MFIYYKDANKKANKCIIDDADSDKVIAASRTAFLKYYGVTTLCPSTVYRWMRALGMNYCSRKKNFYVNGHERADVIKYRKEYIVQYFKDELRMFRWMQLPLDEFYELVCVNLFCFTPNTIALTSHRLFATN